MSRITFLVMCVVLLAFPLLNRALPVLGPDAFDRVSDVLLLPLAMLVLVLARWRGVVSAFHPGAVLYLFMAWGAVGVLSSVNSDWQALALYRQAYAFLGVFFVLALSHVFRGPEWTVEKAFKWLSYGGLIYLAVLWFFMFLIAPSDDYTWLYNVPGFANARFLGFFAVAFVVAAHVFAIPKHISIWTKDGLFTLLVTSLAWSLLFWSGGRAPILAMFAGLGVLWLYGYGKSVKRLGVYAALGAVIGAGLSLVYQVPSAVMGLFRIAGKVSSTSDFSSGRTNLWPDAFESFLESPMIGHGADVFPFVLSGWSSYFNHPHNFPLQFLNSWGLLGGGALMLALAVIGHRLLKRGDKTDGLTFLSLWGALVFALAGLVDGTFYHPIIFLYGAIFMGAALALSPQSDKQPVPWAKSMFAVLMVLVVGVFLRHGQSVIALGNEKTVPMSGQEWETVMSFPSPMSKHGASYIVGMNLDENIRDAHPDVERRLEWALRWSRGGGARELMVIRQAIYEGQVAQGDNRLEALYCRNSAYVRHKVRHMVEHLGQQAPVCDKGE